LHAISSKVALVSIDIISSFAGYLALCALVKASKKSFLFAYILKNSFTIS
jgi:hypothetical protein